MMSVFTGEAADKERAAFEEAGKCTTEATMNVQTVAALGREPTFIEKYSVQLDVPLQSSIKETVRTRSIQHLNGESYAYENVLMSLSLKEIMVIWFHVWHVYRGYFLNVCWCVLFLGLVNSRRNSSSFKVRRYLQGFDGTCFWSNDCWPIGRNGTRFW